MSGNDQQPPPSLNAAKNLRPIRLSSSSSDSDDDFLPAFRDLRRKTLQTLYNLSDSTSNTVQLFRDKSPKGSVDEPIRSLVDLLNAHPDYATLSSCSGRIALFDPCAEGNVGHVIEGVTQEGISESNQVQDNSGSGKGTGRWVLSSHAPIEPQLLVDLLSDDNSGDNTNTDDSNPNSSHPLTFKHEPLLLHITTSTLSSARKLLNLALSLGFRESGIISTPKKCTVAIRTVGLTLTVPLAKRGALRPSDEYLRGLVREANERFDLNGERLQRLYETVERELFEVVFDEEESGEEEDKEEDKKIVSQMTNKEDYEGTFRPLPPLNLWGHAAVAVPGKDERVDIYVFGGHGTGPEIDGRTGSCERSKDVYCLTRLSCRLWRDTWIKERLSIPPGSAITSHHLGHSGLGLEVSPVRFSAREGLAACLLPEVTAGMPSYYSFEPTIVIFGGRAGPSTPFDELLLYRPTFLFPCFWKPVDIRGEAPAARWAHTLTALSGDNGRVALLCGGQTIKGVDSSVYILTQHAKSFLWERVKVEIPVFSHSAVRTLSSSGGDQVYIFGGAADPENLLEFFPVDVEEADSETKGRKPLAYVLNIDQNPEGSEHMVEELDNDSSRSLAGMGASASARLIGPDFPNPAMLISGGIPRFGEGECTMRMVRLKGLSSDTSKNCIFPVRCRVAEDVGPPKTKETKKRRSKTPLKEIPMVEIKAGSMIRHCCLELPKDSDEPSKLVVVGGGVSSFAFGPSFSGSWEVSIEKATPREAKGTPAETNVTNTSNKKKKKRNASKLQKKKQSAQKTTQNKKTNVLYVHKNKAKQLKNALEKEGFLDTTYRMIKANVSAPLEDPSQYIAVPTTLECELYLDNGSSSVSWVALISGRGQQEVPLSTKMLGNRRGR